MDKRIMLSGVAIVFGIVLVVFGGYAASMNQYQWEGKVAPTAEAANELGTNQIVGSVLLVVGSIIILFAVLVIYKLHKGPAPQAAAPAQQPAPAPAEAPAY